MKPVRIHDIHGNSWTPIHNGNTQRIDRGLDLEPSYLRNIDLRPFTQKAHLANSVPNLWPRTKEPRNSSRQVSAPLGVLVSALRERINRWIRMNNDWPFFNYSPMRPTLGEAKQNQVRRLRRPSDLVRKTQDDL